jgi:hypothetical protein
MDYDLAKITSIEAKILHGYKADVNVQIKIKLKHELNIENIQVKLVSNPKGFNQIDKRPVDKYNEVFD